MKAPILISSTTIFPRLAWLLNLRGEDIEFNPVFLSYLLVGERYTHLSLISRPRR